MCSTVKKRYIVVHVIERYELTFTMIDRISSIGPCTKECVAVGRLLPWQAEYAYTFLKNYFRLPRQTIRENSNFIILSPQDAKNLTHIHADHCTNDISLLEFKRFCHGVWSKEHNFVTIDLTSTPTNGKYRQNFNRLYFPTGAI